MTVQLVQHIPENTDFSNSWEALWLVSSRNPFLSPGFFRAWWAGFGEGKTAQLLTFLENDQLVGVLPLYTSETESDTLHSWSNHEVSDYYDVLLDPEIDENEARQQLFSWFKISSFSQISCLSLSETSVLTRWFLPLKENDEQTSLTVTTEQQNVCPVIELPATWEEYLALIGRKQRHEVNRKWRIFEALDGSKMRHNQAPTQAEFAEFKRLHRLSQPEKDAFWTPQTTAFFDQLCIEGTKGGWLQLAFAELDGKNIASGLVFTDATTTYLYNSGFDPTYRDSAAGVTLTAATIKWAIEQGKKTYDFLRGDEVYKFRLGAQPVPVFDFRLQKK